MTGMTGTELVNVATTTMATWTSTNAAKTTVTTTVVTEESSMAKFRAYSILPNGSPDKAKPAQIADFPRNDKGINNI